MARKSTSAKAGAPPPAGRRSVPERPRQGANNLPPQEIRNREHWMPDIENVLSRIEAGLRQEMADIGIDNAPNVPASGLGQACLDQIAKLKKRHHQSRKGGGFRGWTTATKQKAEERLSQLFESAALLRQCRYALAQDNPWFLTVALAESIGFWLRPLAVIGASRRLEADKAAEGTSTRHRDRRLARRHKEIALAHPDMKHYEIIDKLAFEFSKDFQKKNTLRAALRRGKQQI